MTLQASVNLITQSVKCDAGGVAPFSFDVENTSDMTITVGLEPVGESRDWVKLAKAEHAELELPSKAVQRVAVNVAVPAGAQAKRYSFKLRLYDPRTPTITVESGAVAIDVAAPAVVLAGPSAPQPQPVAPPTKRNWLPIIIAAGVGGVVLIGAIVGLILFLTNGATVPDVVGTPISEAAALLEEAGLAAEVTDESTAEQPAGRVVRQTPEGGADMPDDGVVKVVVAAAPSPADPNACKPGFVWREARPGDVVCVTPDTRAQVLADNAAAPSRISPTDRTYGPNTCLVGFVWREAFDGDLVCVTPNIRSQAAADNAEAPNRRVGTQ